MKKILAVSIILLATFATWAQNPKLSFQSVVRDSQNRLVVEQPVSITVNILAADNSTQFQQTLETVTNRNGLCSLLIGDDSSIWSNIRWNGAKIRTAISLPEGTTMIDTTEITAVPLALFANDVGTSALPQSNWAETNADTCTFIKNKPNIADTVNKILIEGNYVTASVLGNYVQASELCNDVTANCTSLATDDEVSALLQALTEQMNEIKDRLNNKIDSLEQQLDSLKHEVSDATFDCGKDKVTDADSNAYTTVKIGTQCWMAQNLRTTHFDNGVLIPTSTQMSNTTPYRYLPGNNAANVPTYGCLYNWSAVIDSNGLCPKGWHVPTEAEWNILANFVYNNYRSTNCLDAPEEFNVPCIAQALASTSGWNSSDKPCAAGYQQVYNNATGFSAFPAGYAVGTAYGKSGNAIFWTSTETDSQQSYYRSINYDYSTLQRSISSKSMGYSVRCVRGESEQPLTDFYCGRDKVIDADSNAYATVKIGTQCWMTQNLRNTHFNDGTAVPVGNVMSSETAPYRYTPGNDENMVAEYGYLYNWAAAASSKGLCPIGWHLPSDAEWTTMTDFVYNSTIPNYKCYNCTETPDGNNTPCIAKALASTSGWYSSDKPCAAGYEQTVNNDTGFAASPAGYAIGTAYGKSGNALFWTSTEADSQQSYDRSINYDYSTLQRSTSSKSIGYSVRCVRN